MYAVDLHNHSRFFHGHDRVGALYDPVGFRLHAAVARARGLDGLAVTNHDYCRAFDGGAGVTTVPGIEISTTDGHLTVVGPDPPRRTEPGRLTPAEAVDLAHERGCAAIIAHPYRGSSVRHSDAPFDAVEINGKHPHTWERVERLAAARDLPMVGGSDAHYPFEVGRAYTLVDAPTLTPAAVADAIRAGDVRCEVNVGVASKLVQRVYRRIHRRKGHWDDWPDEAIGGERAADADDARR